MIDCNSAFGCGGSGTHEIKSCTLVFGENEKKEEPTMKVSYNGFTGELVKLERTLNGQICIPVDLQGNPYHQWFYDLSIYDSEKQVTHSFTGVNLEDVKFLGGEVTFG